MSNNLGRTETTSSQSQKEVTLNDSDGILDAAITESITIVVDSSNSVTLTASQWKQNVMFTFDDTSPAPTGDFDVYVPATSRGFFVVKNATTYTATIQVSGQSETAPTLAAGDVSLFVSDGSNVRLPSAGASTFAIGDASDVDTASPSPQDGDVMMYSLADGKWIAGRIPYDIPLSFSGTPTADTQLLGKVMVVRDVYLPANFLGSYGHVGSNPSITYDIDVKDDGVTIGTISVSTGGTFTFTTVGGVDVVIAAGSRLEFYAPSGSPSDWTIANIAATLKATV